MGTIAAVDRKEKESHPSNLIRRKTKILTKNNEYFNYLDENKQLNSFRWVKRRKIFKLNVEVLRNFDKTLPENAKGPITTPLKKIFQKEKESTGTYDYHKQKKNTGSSDSQEKSDLA
jgi:hypothetical protein